MIQLLQSTARRVASSLGRNSYFVRVLRPAYEKVLDWASGGRGVPWLINGVAFRVDPYSRNRLAHEYDPPVAEFFRQRVRPGDICMDVGANVGIYVLQFAHWCGPSGQVIAFEPNPQAWAVLRRHVALNHLTERVKVVSSAVGASEGEAVLYAVSTDGMSRLDAPNEALAAQAQLVPVQVVTLDRWCETEKCAPDWLLIDIEGFELAALRGARNLIQQRRPHLGIVVEMHPTLWPLARQTREEAAALLAELGLIPVPLTGQADPLDEYGLVHLAYA